MQNAALAAIGAPLGGFDNRHKQFVQFLNVRLNGAIALRGDIAGLVEQVEPVVGFIGFLERNTPLVDKFRLVLGMFRLTHQRAHSRAASQHPLRQHPFSFFALQVLGQFHYPKRKRKQLVIDHIRPHLLAIPPIQYATLPTQLSILN